MIEIFIMGAGMWRDLSSQKTATCVTHLRMLNYRVFKKAALTLHPKLCVFLGDNGSGKTTVLHALATLISNAISNAFKIAGVQFNAISYDEKDVKRLESRVLRTDIVRSEISCNLHMGNALKGFYDYKISMQKERAFLPEKIQFSEKNIFQEIAKRIRKSSSVPVFAYYGAQKGIGTHFLDTAKFSSVGNNLVAAYKGSMSREIAFADFLAWFDAEETIELREKRENEQYQNKQLNVVRQAIERFFQTCEIKITNPRITGNPSEFSVTSSRIGEKDVTLAFSQLSDGYKGMVALIADFARRLAIANQDADIDCLDGEGILLIDEIDAHLHPKWQYRVIEDLRRTFPNVQLIVTTHSAEVVSTVDKESVYVLEPDGGILEEKHPEEQTKGDYTDYIGGTVMGIPDNMDKHPEFKAYMNCLACIQEGNVEGDFFESEHQKVLKAYGENHHFVREINARMEGLRKKKEMMARLKSLRK